MAEQPNQKHEHHAHHEHHNHRESFAINGAEAFLEAHMHDQAATVSAAICPAEGEAFAFARLVDAMREIASASEAAGGIVGHVKAFAREGDAFAHASVTAAGLEPACEGDVEESFGEEADIQLVAIVLLVGQNDLIDICRNALV